MATNYGELKTLVAEFSHRSDLTADIPNFILLAEGTIAREIRAMELVTTTTIVEADRTADTAVYNLPTDFLGARAVVGTTGGGKYSLRQVAISELNMFGTSGIAQIFSVYGDLIEFRGAPGTDIDFTLIYYARPAELTADVDTNDLLSAHPNLYLKASLVELYNFTQDIELKDTQERAFDVHASAINGLAEETRGAAGVKNGFCFDRGSTM